MRAIPALVVALACSVGAGCAPAAESPSSGAIAARPGDGTAPGTVTIRFADLVNVDVRDVPLLMAFDELAASGYRVKESRLNDSALMTDLLARGDADVAIFNNQTAWTAVTKGADIRTVTQFTGPSTLFAARASITTCRDLHGRPVGRPSPSGLSPLLFQMYLDAHCPGTEPDFLLIRESGARAAALLAGHLDASSMPNEELTKLQQQSDTPLHALMSLAEEFPDVQIDGIHVNRAWAGQHPDAVRALIRAQLRAHRAVIANPQVLHDEAARRLSLDAATARAIGDMHLRMGLWDPNGGLTAGNVQSTIDLLINAKALPAGVTAAQVADLSPLNAVLDELGRAAPAAKPDARAAVSP